MHYLHQHYNTNLEECQVGKRPVAGQTHLNRGSYRHQQIRRSLYTPRGETVPFSTPFKTWAVTCGRSWHYEQATDNRRTLEDSRTASTTSTTRATQAQGRSPSCARPSSPHRHHLRAEKWATLGDAPTRDGLW